MSLIISEVWSIKLSNPFKINELSRSLSALNLGQDLVSPPGPPNKASVHLWHPTRVEHTWQPTRGVLGGTRLHIQRENVLSIDSKNEKICCEKPASDTLQFVLSFLILLSSSSPKHLHCGFRQAFFLFLVMVSWWRFRPKFVTVFPDHVGSQQTPFSISFSRNSVLNFKV